MFSFGLESGNLFIFAIRFSYTVIPLWWIKYMIDICEIIAAQTNDFRISKVLRNRFLNHVDAYWLCTYWSWRISSVFKTFSTWIPVICWDHYFHIFNGAGLSWVGWFPSSQGKCSWKLTIQIYGVDCSS